MLFYNNDKCVWSNFIRKCVNVFMILFQIGVVFWFSIEFDFYYFYEKKKYIFMLEISYFVLF